MTARPPRPSALSTFAIGSLPHTQLELAMQVGLSLDVPTLPQLPRGEPAEFMLPQALEGLPGLRFDAEGRTTVDLQVWEKGAPDFGRRLDAAMAGEGLAAFEPSGSACRAWKPFLWEIENRRATFAKAQVAGPLTSAWATALSDGTPVGGIPELSLQIHRLVLARALAMAAALRSTGVTPIIFLDEPGLYTFNPRSPTHAVELRELDFVAAALRREGALVGVHCCGNTDWASVARLDIDFISADARLSLGAILAATPAFDEYLARGGWLGLGIIPTSSTTRAPVTDLVATALALLGDRRPSVLARTVISPACGLAMRTVAESEQTLEDLREAQTLLRLAVGRNSRIH